MSRPIRVGLLGSFWDMEHTGSGQYTRRLYEGAAKRDDVDILPFLGARIPKNERLERYALVSGPGFLGRQVEKMWVEQISFSGGCLREGMQVMHVPYWASPMYHRLPVVLTIHDIIPAILPAYRGSIFVRSYTRLVSAACRRADVILTDSEASANDIVEMLQVPRERVRVVYLAASDMYRPASRKARDELVNRLALPEKYLLYLGGFDCRKNVLLLLDAFAELTRIDPDIELVVAGKLPAKDTPFSPDPRRHVAENDIERVRFLGWVDEQDKPALYSGAIGFCFPSMYEGFGLPVLEALSCGTPCVVGSNSSLPEVAGPGGIAVPLDRQSLVEAMAGLLKDSVLRENLSEAGLQHASGFSWEKTVEQTVEAYHVALEIGS